MAARPRSKRLRMLGGTASFEATSVSHTSSDSSANAPSVRSGMPSSSPSVTVFSTMRGDAFPNVGQCFFDTNLGVPVWWNGLNWVNAMGTKVMTCVIDGVESSVLEGSSLEVEVPVGTSVVVTMGGDDITEEALGNGVVTIPYISGDIEIMYDDSR